MKYILTNQNLLIFIKNTMFIFNKNDLICTQIMQVLNSNVEFNEKAKQIEKLVDLKEKIKTLGCGLFTINNSEILINGKPIASSLQEEIIFVAKIM